MKKGNEKKSDVKEGDVRADEELTFRGVASPKTC